MTLALPPAGTEALDRRTTDPVTARATLRDIARVNAWFGGRAAVCFGLDVLLRSVMPVRRPLTLLDVGAGVGDIAAFIRDRYAARRAVRLHPIALDHLKVAVGSCRAGGLPGVVADLRALPLRARSVDIVVVSQLLHHVEREALPATIAALARLARVGVVVADLRRSAVAAAGIRLASRVLGFHPVTCRDGVVSVRRGFDRDELAAALARAGVAARLFHRWGWRLVAVWTVDGAHD